MNVSINKHIKTHWNYGYRYFMIITLVSTAALLGFLVVLPKNQAWGLSWFDGGASLFGAMTMPLLIQAVFLPVNILCLMALPKRGRFLHHFLPQSPKQIYLKEMALWLGWICCYIGLITWGCMWVEDVSLQYDTFNALEYSMKTLPQMSIIMIIFGLQIMLGVLYVFAKQVSGPLVISSVVIVNGIGYMLINLLCLEFQLQFFTLCPIIIVVLLGLLIWKFDWINKIYQ